MKVAQKLATRNKQCECQESETRGKRSNMLIQPKKDHSLHQNFYAGINFIPPKTMFIIIIHFSKFVKQLKLCGSLSWGKKLDITWKL